MRNSRNWTAVLVIGPLLFLAASWLLVRVFVYEPFRIPSRAMAPTFEAGALVIATKWGYGSFRLGGLRFGKGRPSAEIRRGDILIFEYPPDPSLDYVKRVVGLPGDKVSYSGKRLKINDRDVPTQQVDDYVAKDQVSYRQFSEKLDGQSYSVIVEAETLPAPRPQAFLQRERCTYAGDGFSCQVPDGHYFMMGDNRDNSADSRIWGFVPAENLVGKVEYVLRR